MSFNFRGIVLKKVAFGDRSNILRIYTRQAGIQSFIIGVGGKSKARAKAVFMPLSIVDIVGKKGKSEIIRISEFKLSPPTPELQTNVYKSAIVMFINEMLVKSIKEEEANEPLFEYLENAIVALSKMEVGIENFHLLFLIRLSHYLGFMPQDNYSSAQQYFDLMEGQFVGRMPEHEQHLPPELCQKFCELIRANFSTIASLKISNEERRTFIHALIDLYKLHLPNFGNVKSHEVLETVLS